MNRGISKKVLVGFIAWMLLIHGILFWRDRSLIAKGYPDFTIFYSAGLIMRQGLGHQLYDDVVQYRIQREFASGVVTRHGNLPFNHPPFEALIFVPLTYLHYLAAYAAWELLNLGMLVLIVRLLRPHIIILKQCPLRIWVLALLAFFPVFAALLQGQDVVLLLLLQTLAFVALKRDADFLAGCWLGLGSFKYHLVLALVAIIWLGWKRTKVPLGFLITCVCLAALSVSMVGWEQAERYPGYVLHLERVMVHDAMVPAIMPNLRGLMVGWLWPSTTLNGLKVATLVFSCALLLWALMISRKYLGQKMELQFALATLVAVLVSYHSFVYDLILLVIPLLTTLTLLVANDFRWQRDWTFFTPAGILLLSPLYVFLAFGLVHSNLLAIVLLFWLWGIRRKIIIQP